jgi:hypothetical protein
MYPLPILVREIFWHAVNSKPYEKYHNLFRDES